MTLVVDASVALKWFVTEDGSATARRLLADRSRLFAPDLVVSEVCNGAWKLARRGALPADQCHFAAAQIGTLFATLFPLGPLAPRAMAIARQFDHPVYDCFYLALTETLQARLVTADRRLIARLRGSILEARVDNLYALDPDC